MEACRGREVWRTHPERRRRSEQEAQEACWARGCRAQAREGAKSIPMMEQAAAKSDEGELYVRLGNVYLDGDQFAKAADSVTKGLEKGGVKRPDQARLVLGMAYFNLGEYGKARKAFRDAGKDERSEKYSKQWITYVTSEEDRQRELEKDLL